MAISSILISSAAAATTFTAGALAFSTTAFLVNAAVGLALYALSPKPKQPGANRGYSVNSRGSALDHQIIYGKVT